MRLLLDTHIFLWYISGDSRLRSEIRDAISDSQNEVYLSVISIWESLVKHSLGKLTLPASPAVYLPTQRERHLIASLALDEQSVLHLENLPAIHRDPFDRILVCQSIEHNLTIVTADDVVCAYTENVLR